MTDPSHLDDISRSCRVKIQQYAKGETKGVYIIGSKSNCIDATKILDEKVLRINTDIIPLEPFTLQKKEAPELFNSISQENLDNIGTVTRTSIKKITGGIAGPVRFSILS